MNALSLAGALAGVLYGYAAERGDFCLATALERRFVGRDAARARTWALAIGVQMLIVPLLFLVGIASPGLPAFYPAGALVGGLLFGVSLRWSGGCSASLFHRAGAGRLDALAGLMGFALGASVLELGPFVALRVRVHALAPVAGHWDPTAWLGLPLSLIAPLCGALVLWAAWRDGSSGQARAPWRRTGLVVGGVASLGWALSALCARDYGLSELPGLLGLMRLPSRGVPPGSAFDVLFVLGLPLGGFLASRRAGGRPWAAQLPSSATFLQRGVAGVGLGLGVSLAAGGSLGHVLVGVPLLATGSLVTSSAIVAGAWFAARLR